MKRTMGYILAGIVMALLLTVVRMIGLDGQFNILITSFLMYAVIFSILFSTYPYVKNTLQPCARECNTGRVISIISVALLLVSIALVILLLAVRQLGVIAFCEIALVIITVGMIILLIISAIIKEKATALFVVKCIIIQILVEMALFGLGTTI